MDEMLTPPIDLCERKETLRETLVGDGADRPSELLLLSDELLVVVWLDVRDSTDQEDKSSERGRANFIVIRRSSVDMR